jgi:argininosuccinate synthase
MYHGGAYTPLRYELEAFIEESQKNVSGKYRVKLYKGTCEILSRESNSGLFFPEIRSIKATGFDQRKCANAAFVRGLQFIVLAKREEKKKEKPCSAKPSTQGEAESGKRGPSPAEGLRPAGG